MRVITLLLGVVLVLRNGLFAADDAKAIALADAVIQASGGANWAKVKTIDFTFNVEQGGKLIVSAEHHWDVAANTDVVTSSNGGKKTETVDLNRGSAAGGGYKRWTNDSYWLLAPLKLRDPGTQLSYQGQQEVDGENYEVIQLAFQQVGMTPGDKYNVYIDPGTKLVRRWDYMPSADKKVSGTWDGYKEFGGLKLATEHQFGGNRIYFTQVKVVTD